MRTPFASLPALSAALVALVVAGCRSTKDVLTDYGSKMSAGQYGSAATEPERLADQGGRDALCWQLHAAAAERLAGDNAEAIRRFDLAEDLYSDADGKGAVARTASTGYSLMTGDYVLPYEGSGQDRIFTCLYKAIDFGVQGKTAAVRTELNRARLHQQNWLSERSAELASTEAKMKGDAESHARSNGVRTVPAAAAATNALGNAAFAATLRAQADFDAARDGRLDLLTESDYANAYVTRVHDTFRRYVGDSGPKPRDMVAVFVEDGLCPMRAEWRMDLPTFLIPGLGRYAKYVGMALPKLVYRNEAVTAYSVSGGGSTYPMSFVQDVDKLVKTEFDLYFRGALVREITRVVVNVGVQAALGAAARNADGNARALMELIQWGVAAYGLCANGADVRSWTALPKKVYMLDLPRPQDGKVTVTCGQEKVRLDLPPGNSMVFVRKVSSAAPSAVKTFTLPN